MNILAFAGSNSHQSINRKLVQHCLSHLPNVKINFLDLNDYEMPLFSVDREKQDGHPPQAHKFREQIEECDGIVVSLAEHNRSYTVAFKNIFDWTSRIDLNIFRNKPMFLMSTSPGGFGGGNVMTAAKSFFPKCGADIIETFSLPSFYQNFDEALGIKNAELKTDFETRLQVFKTRMGIE